MPQLAHCCAGLKPWSLDHLSLSCTLMPWLVVQKLERVYKVEKEQQGLMRDSWRWELAPNHQIPQKQTYCLFMAW